MQLAWTCDVIEVAARAETSIGPSALRIQTHTTGVIGVIVNTSDGAGAGT